MRQRGQLFVVITAVVLTSLLAAASASAELTRPWHGVAVGHAEYHRSDGDYHEDETVNNRFVITEPDYSGSVTATYDYHKFFIGSPPDFGCYISDQLETGSIGLPAHMEGSEIQPDGNWTFGFNRDDGAAIPTKITTTYAGTNPFTGESCASTETTDFSEATIGFNISGPPGSAEPGQPTVTGSQPIPTIGNQSFTEPGISSATATYQLSTLADTDGDGLPDTYELKASHTDPFNPDTDGDGLHDGDEVGRHTDPLNPDTDGDGLTDGQEVNGSHTDPLNPDTDGDGLTDGQEVNGVHTNPLNPDTDGGGAKDGDELKDGTDPNDPSDDRTVCNDKQDNDGDGIVDYPADPGCESPQDGDESNGAPQCSNGLDDDGDGKTDFPADPGCESKADDNETDEIKCKDGKKVSVPVGAAVAVGCFTKGKDGVWRTSERALLSGLEVTLLPGGSFSVDPAAKRVSGPAVIHAGPLPVWLLARHPWDTGKAKQDLTLPDGIKSKLEDLPLQASASLTFKAGDGGSSAFAGTIKIPDLGQKLRSLQVGGADSSIAFTVGNQSGFSLNSVEANIEEISLSPDDFPGREFSFKDLHLKYSKVPEGSLWEASGLVHLPFMINNGPIRTDWSLLGGVQILNGTLVGMKLGAQDLNRYIGEGFFLQRLSGEITTLDDWVIKLEGAGTLGPKIPDFPEPPFAIDPASVAVGEATKCDKGGLAMEAAVTGQIAKAYKGLKGSIGGQYCLNFDNPSSSITADIDLGLVKGDVELAHAKGTVKGWFAGAQAFNIEGSGNVSIGKITTGGKFVLSDYGAAVCSKFLFFSGGVGYRYSIDSWPHLFEGCDIGPWRSPAAAAAAVGDSRVTVPAGLPFAGFQVTGAGGVPRISLRAPGGHTIVTGMEAVNSPQVVAVPSESDSTVYVFVNKPQAGSWTVSTEPGSVAITSIKTARGLRQPVVGAHVSKRGTGSVLRWHLTPLPGQRVTFYEQGAHFTRLLTGTTAARGMKRFTPMRGRTGRRTIVAVVTQDGLPRTRMEVAHFNYRLVPLAAPRGLKASRKGSLLRASWHPVPGATRYLAEVRAGKSVLARQLVRSSGLRAPALAGVTLSVRALDSLGSAGKARVVRVR